MKKPSLGGLERIEMSELMHGKFSELQFGLGLRCHKNLANGPCNCGREIACSGGFKNCNDPTYLAAQAELNKAVDKPDVGDVVAVD